MRGGSVVNSLPKISHGEKKEILKFLDYCEENKRENLWDYDFYVVFQREGLNSDGVAVRREETEAQKVIFPYKNILRVEKNGKTFLVSSISNVHIKRFSDGAENEKKES